MERGRFSEEKRRIYTQRMSRALLVEVAEIMRLYGLTDKAKREDLNVRGKVFGPHRSSSSTPGS